MIHVFKSSRFVSTVLWTVIIAGSLVGGSGCKQVSTWSNFNRPAPTPSADPFGYPDNYQRPELAPTLSPVPDLLSPGHSNPTDPVPPAPGEGANSSNSRNSVTSRLRNFRPMSLFQRKDSRSDSVQSVSAVNESPGSTMSTERTPLHTATLTPPPASRPDRSATTVPASGERSRTNLGASESVISVPNATTQTQAVLPDKPYSGPIITPGSQYTINRDAPIQNRNSTQPANDRPVVRLRKPTPQVVTDDFAPKTPLQPLQTQPSPQGPPSSAAVPLLLPPGA